MKPSHVTAFAPHFLNGLPTSFKHTILVCEKLAHREVVIKGVTAVGVVSANGELLINMEGFIKSLVDHGDGYQQNEVTLDKFVMGDKKGTNPPEKFENSDGSGRTKTPTGTALKDGSSSARQWRILGIQAKTADKTQLVEKVDV
ncbi:unnamed protein product [Prunus armeniaca]|uniref:Uncharacterized protein n=1 Tax=Prunus armeniaca TaxID=36596 RepID=A0A6J5U474_PRUAR|nr:unnamed protein product [Prunus armeniaca]